MEEGDNEQDETVHILVRSVVRVCQSGNPMLGSWPQLHEDLRNIITVGVRLG